MDDGRLPGLPSVGVGGRPKGAAPLPALGAARQWGLHVFDSLHADLQPPVDGTLHCRFRVRDNNTLEKAKITLKSVNITLKIATITLHGRLRVCVSLKSLGFILLLKEK